MDSFLNIALECINRGWYVFPCKPKSKEPQIHGGVRNATLDEGVILAWWKQFPDANPAIACLPSNLSVIDSDHGTPDEASARAWINRLGLPETLTVHTGRRFDGDKPEFGIHLYYSGTTPSVDFEQVGATGQVRSAGGEFGTYVMAPGSVHPDSGEVYEILDNKPIAPLPEFVRSWKSVSKAENREPGQKIKEGARSQSMFNEACALQARGWSDEAILGSVLLFNELQTEVPLSEEQVEKQVQGALKKAKGELLPAVTIGTPETPKDWRERYATFEQFRDVKPPSFLIDQFLEDEAILCIGAPVAQRKSIVVANVIASLLTGEPLFGHFPVVKQPERVIYLCPEMGLSEIARRLGSTGLGLESYAGSRLFIRSMDDKVIKLTDLDEELPGSVVVLDTLTRFVQGDQNNAEAMARFADLVFEARRKKCTVILLHHSVKGAGDSKMTLDGALRGSTELAAFVTCVWATQLVDTDQPHTTPSDLKCVKQRGFAAEPFQVTCDKKYRMTMSIEPGKMVEAKSEKEQEAIDVLTAILKASPKLGINKIQEGLKAKLGKGKKVEWVKKERAKLLAGVVVSTS